MNLWYARPFYLGGKGDEESSLKLATDVSMIMRKGVIIGNFVFLKEGGTVSVEKL